MSNVSGLIPAWICAWRVGHVWSQIPCEEVDYLCSPVNEAVGLLRDGNPALVAGGDLLAVRRAMGVGTVQEVAV
jgi:hypothetical protein